MVPFRIYDRDNKEMWIVLNYHAEGASYLVAREGDDEKDGEMKLLPAAEITQYRLVDFLEEADSV